MWDAFNKNHHTPDQLLDRLGLLQTPVDIHQVAQKLGISVTHWGKYQSNISGQIVYDGATAPKIFVNSNRSRHHQRFTIAHELAHAVLHLVPGQPANLSRDTDFHADENRVEAQANGYGAGLLMPYSLLAKWGPYYLWDVDALAAQFDVSSESMTIRINSYFRKFVR